MEASWFEIATYVFGFLGLLTAGVAALKFKQFVQVLKDLGDAFTTTATAIEDAELTALEAKDILTHWQVVAIAILALVGRKPPAV